MCVVIMVVFIGRVLLCWCEVWMIFLLVVWMVCVSGVSWWILCMIVLCVSVLVILL